MALISKKGPLRKPQIKTKDTSRIAPEQIDAICDLYVAIYGSEPNSTTLETISKLSYEQADIKEFELRVRQVAIERGYWSVRRRHDLERLIEEAIEARI